MKMVMNLITRLLLLVFLSVASVSCKEDIDFGDIEEIDFTSGGNPNGSNNPAPGMVDWDDVEEIDFTQGNNTQGNNGQGNSKPPPKPDLDLDDVEEIDFNGNGNGNQGNVGDKPPPDIDFNDIVDIDFSQGNSSEGNNDNNKPIPDPGIDFNDLEEIEFNGGNGNGQGSGNNKPPPPGIDFNDIEDIDFGQQNNSSQGSNNKPPPGNGIDFTDVEEIDFGGGNQEVGENNKPPPLPGIDFNDIEDIDFGQSNNNSQGSKPPVPGIDFNDIDDIDFEGPGNSGQGGNKPVPGDIDFNDIEDIDFNGGGNNRPPPTPGIDFNDIEDIDFNGNGNNGNNRPPLPGMDFNDIEDIDFEGQGNRPKPPPSGSMDCECGIERLSLRIRNGKTADASRFPWMVSIIHSSRVCGGSLISDRHILTSARCVARKRKEDIKVLLGVSSETERILKLGLPIDEIFVHEGYSDSQRLNNLAVIRLRNPVDVSARGFSHICLSNRNNVDQNLFLTGWGFTQDASLDGFLGSKNLRETDVQLQTSSWCSMVYGRFFTSKKMCAGMCSGGSFGDGGSPLSERRAGRVFQVGVTDFGHKGCDKGRQVPDVFESVFKSLDWIRSKTRGGRMCRNPDFK